MLKIFNTLTRQKEEFKPIHAGEVGMYVCGITVYDLCHIGHGRTFVAFDVVARYLRFLGYKLKYVRNITDIDDKIIKRANENGESFVAMVDRMIAEMHKDFDALNILRPDMEPRATHHIAEIIELTEQLIAKGHAYVADNGDVMFDVPTDPTYGVLSRQDLDQLQAGARVDVVDDKRNPMDFVLWKMSKEGEPSWPSPWGAGRPGVCQGAAKLTNSGTASRCDNDFLHVNSLLNLSVSGFRKTIYQKARGPFCIIKGIRTSFLPPGAAPLWRGWHSLRWASRTWRCCCRSGQPP